MVVALAVLAFPFFAFAAAYGSGAYGSGSYAGAPPSVTTDPASSIDQTSATLNGTITDIGTTSPTVRGFVYGADATYGATTTDSDGPFSTGSFAAALSGLTCGSTYHFAAYASSTNGIAYGSDQSFAMSACSSGGGGGGGGNGPIVGSISNTSSGTSALPITTTAATAASSTAAVAISACSETQPAFNRTLGRGMRGEDVRKLQAFLNSHGFEVAASGDGSSGQETEEFGAKTEAALIRFQEANAIAINLTRFTGLFGEATRAYVNSLISKSACPAPSTVSSSATTTSAATSSQDLNALLAEVARLQAMLAQLQGGSEGSIQIGAKPTRYEFKRDLELSMTGEDVRALQQYLNAVGYAVAADGPGSAGQETPYFGSATQKALATFQAANGLPSTGYFGPMTRKLIDSAATTTAQ
jgi:peptidoglycan hydrolase-like protein with peptidoglycan-binding domain